jgi:hypothetical protein
VVRSGDVVNGLCYVYYTVFSLLYDVLRRAVTRECIYVYFGNACVACCYEKCNPCNLLPVVEPVLLVMPSRDLC